MNAFVRPAEVTTRRFTIDDVYAMTAAGLFDDDRRFELIDGELIEMPAEGSLHKDWSIALGRWLIRNLGDDHAVVPGSTLVLAPTNAPQPDWCVFAADRRTDEIRGPDVLLAIEQSDASLSRDLGWKANLYAAYGVRDYWVIDLKARMLHVHRDPTPEGYGFKQRFAADATVESLLIPRLAICLSNLTRVS